MRVEILPWCASVDWGRNDGTGVAVIHDASAKEVDEHTFFHTELKEMVSNKTSPGPKEAHLFLSGTKVREMLSEGKDLPAEFTRPEVSAILKEHYQGAKVG